MFLLDSVLKSWAKRARDRVVRGLRSELADVRRELAGLRRELAAAGEADRALAAAVREVQDELARVRTAAEAAGRANEVLAETGLLSTLTQADRTGDVTVQGAMGYPSWEAAVAAYRPAFRAALDYLRSACVRGPVVEFGTCTGFTARQFCELMNARDFDEHLYLYDSFEGLPETTGTPDEGSYEVAANKVWHKGSMAVPPGYEEKIREALLRIRPAEKVHLVKGFFDRTLDAGLPREKCSLVHVDCDVYTSAKYVLTKLADRDLFQDGCVVLFDDWNCNRANPAMGERRALAEFLRENPRWTCSPWFAYGWNATAFVFHDGDAAR
jgi:hypothetical protein